MKKNTLGKQTVGILPECFLVLAKMKFISKMLFNDLLAVLNVTHTSFSAVD